MQKALKKKHKLLILAAPAALGAALCLYLNITATSHITLWPCPLLEYAGVACPGCGATRCICAILTFRFFDALKYNLAIFAIFFYLAGAYLFCVYKVIRYNEFIKIKSGTLWAIAACLVLFALIRNLPFYPWHIDRLYNI